MTKERTRRWFIQTAAVAGLVAGGAGIGAAAGCGKEEDCNKFGDREDQPGNDPRDDITKAVGHNTDNIPHEKYNEPNVSPNDKGQRVGHCKFDDRDDS
jgi:hypothetical protein